MKEIEAWRELGPLAEVVVSGKIDGFEIPREFFFKVPVQWPDGKSVVKYNTIGGIFVFREGTCKNYGYENEDDFRKALKARRVRAQSIEGAVAIGRSRYGGKGTKWIGVQLYLKEKTVPLEFLAGSVEEAEKMSEMLKNMLGEKILEVRIGERKRVLKDALGRVFWTDPVSLYKMVQEKADDRQKRAMAVLLFWAVIVGIVSVLSFLEVIWWWLDLLAMLLFVVVFLFVAGFLEVFGKK